MYNLIKSKDFDFGEDEDHKAVLPNESIKDNLRDDHLIFTKVLDISELNNIDKLKDKKFSCNYKELKGVLNDK